MNKTFLTVFALIGIFLCGAIVGGIVAARLVPATVQKKAADQQLNSQQWVRITNRLKPTEEQREKIRAAVAVYMQEQQHSRKVSQNATEKLHESIREILTPEQVAEYEKARNRIKENERLWQRWFRDQRAKYGESPLVPPAGAQPEKDSSKDGKSRRKSGATTTSGTGS